MFKEKNAQLPGNQREFTDLKEHVIYRKGIFSTCGRTEFFSDVTVQIEYVPYAVLGILYVPSDVSDNVYVPCDVKTSGIAYIL